MISLLVFLSWDNIWIDQIALWFLLSFGVMPSVFFLPHLSTEKVFQFRYMNVDMIMKRDQPDENTTFPPPVEFTLKRLEVIGRIEEDGLDIEVSFSASLETCGFLLRIFGLREWSAITLLTRISQNLARRFRTLNHWRAHKFFQVFFSICLLRLCQNWIHHS